MILCSIPDLHSLILTRQQLDEQHHLQNVLLCSSDFLLCHQPHHEECQLQLCLQPVRTNRIMKEE